jgi:hypothetical protein
MVDNVIRLDVGGKIFATYKETLLKYPETMLSAMFNNGHTLKPNENGHYFFDRDPKLFKVIMRFYRTGKLPEELNDDLEEELNFWCIPFEKEVKTEEENPIIKGPHSIVDKQLIMLFDKCVKVNLPDDITSMRQLCLTMMLIINMKSKPESMSFKPLNMRIGFSVKNLSLPDYFTFYLGLTIVKPKYSRKLLKYLAKLVEVNSNDFETGSQLQKIAILPSFKSLSKEFGEVLDNDITFYPVITIIDGKIHKDDLEITFYFD